jgi:SAM-dependent methyltransferase
MMEETMREQAEKNKVAWEYRAYEFWNNQGSPVEKAKYIKNDPVARLRYHQKYFQNIEGMKIANPCGSNGRIAVPLALLGADVTIFDISEENKRYALELAECAGTDIQYIVCDCCNINLNVYTNYFDIVYSEGGILHYFSDIDIFTSKLYEITKNNGRLILSDFHPFRKINQNSNASQTCGDYFDSNMHNGDVAYKSFFPSEEQYSFPDCSLRFYTLSEIINSVIKAGFIIKEFNEHPNWNDKKIPGEFTIIADKI